MTRIALIIVVLVATVACAPTTAPTTTAVSADPGAVVTLANPSRADLVGTGAWVPLPGASIAVQTGPGDVIDAEFWSSTACSGLGNRYVRVLVDGIELSSAPLTALPAASAVVEESTLVRGSTMAGSGTHQVSVETRIDPGTSCVVVPNYWHLRVDVLN